LADLIRDRIGELSRTAKNGWENCRRSGLFSAVSARRLARLPGMENRKPHEHFKALKNAYVSSEGRITDRGAGHGLTAYDLYLLEGRGHRKTYITITTGLVTLVILVILVIVVSSTRFHIDPSTLRGLFRASLQIGLNAATVFLTFGLLLITWRYVNLTRAIVEEMRETRRREYEPQLVIYAKPWLTKNAQHDGVDASLTIRNYGRVPALAVSLRYDLHNGPGSSFEVTDVIAPSEESTFDLSFKTNELENYVTSELQLFMTLRVSYMDNQANFYTLTQDYGLEGQRPMLKFQCEYVSTPQGSRWRVGGGSFALPGMLGTEMVFVTPDGTPHWLGALVLPKEETEAGRKKKRKQRH
jgi:hypothetical protein